MHLFYLPTDSLELTFSSALPGSLLMTDRLPSVSKTTAATFSVEPEPEFRIACKISISLMRSFFIALLKNWPFRNNRRGSDLMTLLNQLEWTERKVMTYCNK